MENAGRTMIIGPVAWGGVWGHGPELARFLAVRREVLYFDPLRPPNPSAPSFTGDDSCPPPSGLRVHRRTSRFAPGILYGIEMEWKNFLAALRSGADSLVTYYALGSVLALLWFRLRGRRSMLVSADSPELLRHPLARVLSGGIGLRLSAALASVSLATSGPLHEDLARVTRRRALVTNGVNLDSLPAEVSRAERVSGAPFTVGFIGFFGEWVDLGSVVEAARALPDVRFVLVGEGPARDCMEGREKGLENVTFAGRVPHSRVFDEIARMDLCLVPFAVNEVTDRVNPVKLFEYWALGKPVLASACRELIRMAEIEPGALDIYRHPGELTEKIRALRDNRELRENNSRRAREAVVNHDWKVLGERIEKLLHG